MKFGVCCGPELAGVFADAGFDYLEVSVQKYLMPLASDDDFAPCRAQLAATRIPCLRANSFLPASLKVTGPLVDRDAVAAYVETACRRAHDAGIAIIVFGSGNARNVPDQFPRDTAWHQLLDFARMAGDRAAHHHVTIVVEPLRRQETNILDSVAESAAFVRETNHPAIRLLVDAYHWSANAEPVEDIVAAAPLIAHTHIAEYATRKFPGSQPCDFAPFFSALQRGGYNDSVSIEGSWDGSPDSAARAAAILRSYVQ